MTLDYKRQNLQGHCFKGQMLAGAKFTGADIRGVDFTHANLKGADFRNTVAGVPKTWSIVLRFFAFLLAFLSGVVTGYVAIFPGLLLSLENLPGKTLFISINITIFLIFLGILVCYGFSSRLGTFVIIVLSITVILAISIPGKDESYTNALGAIILQPVSLSFWAIALLSSSLALGLLTNLEKKFSLIFPCLLLIFGTFMGGFVGGSDILSEYIIASIAIAISKVIVFLVVIVYINFRSISGDKRYSIIRKAIIHISSLKSTRFNASNLTEADFTGAKLEYVDFRDAVLKRTCWFKAVKIDLSRTENTYLENRLLRDLVVSKDGSDKDFSYMNLRELNLDQTVMVNSCLIGSDLSEATLRYADLSKAKLAKARLYGADLTYAILTGACIQDWAISTDTELGAIECDFVYMRLPTSEDPDPWRKPDNRKETFKPGDFTDFIAPIVKTLDLYRQQNIDPRVMGGSLKSLDLYHYGGIDPTAAAIALKQLAEENPQAELEVVALEGRGSEKIRLQAVVAGLADSSLLNKKYFEKYKEISSLPYTDIQSLLVGSTEKDQRIRSLENLLENALSQPKFYVETYHNRGDFVMTQSKGNVSISGVQGSISGVSAAGENQTMTGVAIGVISGSVSNAINQLPTSSDPGVPGLKELLAELQAIIESEPELSEEDKIDALEQVQTLAEAGQNPEDSVLQKSARTAMKILKGTISGVSETTKLVLEGTNLLTAVKALLIFL